jgi:hypothetical protein
MATLLNSTILLNELVMRFQNNLKAGNLARHAYDDEFAKGGKYGKKGETISVIDPLRFVVTEAANIAETTIVERKKDIKCDTQAHAAFSFTSREKTMSIDKFAEKYLDNCAVALANSVDVALLTKMYQTIPNYVGAAGVTPDEFLTYLQAGEALDRNACPPGQRYGVISPRMNTAIVNELKGLLVPSKELGAQFLTGRIGNAAGLELLMDQNVRTATGGTQGVAGACLVRTTVAATQSTLAVKGLTATTGTVTAGTKFTVAGVYAVNPVSGDSLAPELRQFVVLNTETADGSGYATLDVYPEINYTAPDKTVSAYPVQEAVITFANAASQSYACGIVAHPEAFQWATVPLETPPNVDGKTVTDPDTGISMRMITQYAIATDKNYTRVDIMYGVSAIRPEWGCVILG